MAIYICCECEQIKDTDHDNYTECPVHKLKGMCDDCKDGEIDKAIKQVFLLSGEIMPATPEEEEFIKLNKS